MTPEQRTLAEEVLRHLCLGARISEIHSGYPLRIYLDRGGESEPTGLRYIGIESKWCVLDATVTGWPHGAADLPEMSHEDELAGAQQLQDDEIQTIKVSEAVPHLMISMRSGKKVFVSGDGPKFECWEVGVKQPKANQIWLVVGGAGGGLWTWAPASFVDSAT